MTKRTSTWACVGAAGLASFLAMAGAVAAAPGAPSPGPMPSPAAEQEGAIAAADPAQLAGMLGRIPPQAGAVMILPRGSASDAAFTGAVERLGRASQPLWPRVVAGLPPVWSARIDQTAPAAVLVAESVGANPPEGQQAVPGAPRLGAGSLATLRLVCLASATAPADWQSVHWPAETKAADGATPQGPWIKAAGGAYAVIANDAPARMWWQAYGDVAAPEKTGETPPPNRGQALWPADAALVANAALVVLLRRPDDQAARQAATADTPPQSWSALPHAPALLAAVGGVERAFGVVEALAGVLVVSSQGLAPKLAVTFADGTAGARYCRSLSAEGRSRPAPFADLALGSAAVMLDLPLSPQATRASMETLVQRGANLLRREAPQLADDFDQRAAAVVEPAAAAVEALTLSVGLPSGGKGIVGLQGRLELVAGTPARQSFVDLTGLANEVLAAAGKWLAMPVSVQWRAGEQTLAQQPVDSLQLTIGGEGFATATTRGLLNAVLGPQGAKLLVAVEPLPPPVAGTGAMRVPFALAENAPLLATTMAGKGTGPRADSAEAKALARLSDQRHATLLVSVGRVLALGRRMQQNALRLPEWKPMGFVAAGLTLMGSTARLELEAPWAEAEAIGAWLAQQP